MSLIFGGGGVRLQPGLLLPGIGHPLAGGTRRTRAAVYFESAAVITTLVLLGQVLELRACQHRRRPARPAGPGKPQGLGRIGPDGSEQEIDLAEVRIGDRLRARPARPGDAGGWRHRVG